jgi:hypothetical protein
MRLLPPFVLFASVAVAAACGSSPPPAPEAAEPATPAEPAAPAATAGEPETPAPETTTAPEPTASAAPTTPPPAPFTPEEETAWKKSEEKLVAAAKKADKACGSTLTVELPKERWTGKVLAASGPDALSGGGLPVCIAGLDAVTKTCKKDAKLKTTFAGWIKQYRCWPSQAPSVGTSNEAFELAFLLPGRTPAEYEKMVSESLEASLKAAAK